MKQAKLWNISKNPKIHFIAFKNVSLLNLMTVTESTVNNFNLFIGNVILGEGLNNFCCCCCRFSMRSVSRIL